MVQMRVTFIRERPFFRVYRNALALKRTGKFHLTLIGRDMNEKFITDLFDEVIPYGVTGKAGRFGGFINHKFENKCFQNLAKLVKKSQTDIFHTVAVPDTVPKIVMQNAGAPVVYDEQDFIGISNGMENISASEKELEKFCFENADGVLYKGPKYELEYYKKNGYQIKCPAMQWLPYCDESLFESKSSGNEEIHIVYAGNISLTPNSMYSYYIPMAKELAKQKIHFHIYPPVPKIYKIAKAYRHLDKKEKYFHFHNSLPYPMLVKEMAKYDFGLWVHNFDTSTGAYKEKWKVAIGNKMFSYLEAGLPVIVNKEIEYGSRLVMENKMGIVIKNREEIGKAINSADYSRLYSNVLKARKKLSIEKNVNRLVNFYQKLV